MSQKKNKQTKITKIMISIAWTIAVLVCVKSIFTDFGDDNAYQIAMSYRHLSGDKMFLQMWEPHQMSIFLNDILMFLYHLIVPSYAGVALYLQVCGTLMFAAGAVVIFKTFKPYTGEFLAHMACIFFIIFRVKQTPAVEFANMEIYFSALLLCSLVKFYETKKVSLLVLAAVLTFLMILSYPACILTGVAEFMILLFSKKLCGGEKIDSVTYALLYAGILAALGLVYVSYFAFTIGLSRYIELLKNIFHSDSHSTTRFSGYWTGFLYALAGICVSLLIGAVIYFATSLVRRAVITPKAYRKELEEKELREKEFEEKALNRESIAIKTSKGEKSHSLSYLTVTACCLLAMEIVLILFQRKTGIDWNCSIYIMPLVLLVLGCAAFKKMSPMERTVFITGAVIAASSCAASLILTNLGMITVVAYLALGGVVSFIPMKYLCRDHKSFAFVIIALLLFHRGALIWGYGNTNSRVLLTYEAQNIIRSGPALGIVCDHVTKNMAQKNQEDFARYAGKDDKVLIVGEALMDPMDFLYAGAEISNYSTIDTPTYTESIEEYFKINPGKVPTVVAVACWYGQMRVPEDSYIMNWVNERYEMVGDGDYYRFYKLK